MEFKLDEDVGEKPGVELFEIYKENGALAVKRVEKISDVKLESDKTYAIIETKDQKSDEDKYSVHVWEGEDVDEEGQRDAETIGQAIYEKLDKKPTLHMEKEGNESTEFLEYFNVNTKSEDKLEDKKPKMEDKKPKMKNCLKTLLFQLSNLLLIFLIFGSMQTGCIYRHIPDAIRKEPSQSLVQTGLHALYGIFPEVVTGYLPELEPLQKEYGIEFLLLIGLSLWSGIIINNFMNRLCTKNRRSCVSCLCRNMIVFCGIVGCISAFDNGCIPKTMPVAGGLSFGVWVVSLLIL